IPMRQAFSYPCGHPCGPKPQSIQQARDAGSGAGDEKDVRALEPGKTIKRQLESRQQHLYRINLSADQLLKAVVEQQGVDVAVQISGPDGKPGNRIWEFDSEIRPQGSESISLVAEAAGEYRLTVRSKSQEPAAGSYQMRVEELRAAT